MKLSIVIPAYNEEKYIGICLKSVIKEIENSNREIEIIVVNNASKDNTKKVAQSFDGVIVIDEYKKGIVRARSAGYNASNGDIIANIDSDGWLPKGWIDTVFREFENDAKLVALSGPDIYPEMSKTFNFIVQSWYLVGLIGHFFNQYVLRNGSMLQGGNFIVRRSAMEKINGYDTSIEFYGEDTDVACRIVKVGKVKFTFALPMYTSSRRFRGEGVIKTGLLYAINHVWTIFFKKPFSSAYNDFRSGKKI
jgi:glycosyltransferase involved in cell wall biosynthesis